LLNSPHVIVSIWFYRVIKTIHQALHRRNSNIYSLQRLDLSFGVAYLVLNLFQTISHFGFSIYIDFPI
jgi:hypothetical protein